MLTNQIANPISPGSSSRVARQTKEDPGHEVGVKTAVKCFIHKIDKKKCEMLPFAPRWGSGRTM